MMRIEKKYSGVIVPMVTPINADFSIDQDSVGLIMKTFTKTNCSSFIMGTTGESVSISEKNRAVLVKSTLKYSNGKIKVYAGISGNCQQESIDYANEYAEAGVDAVVAHLPFYYPMKPANMVRYFERIADHIKCPLVLYNNPITVKWSIPLEVIEELSYHKNIVAIKDSERGMERLDKSLELWASRNDFSYLLGWTAQSAYAISKGCDGIVPSTANLTPQLFYNLYKEALMGNMEMAERLQQTGNRITEIYQRDRNISESIPALKVIMNEYGLCKTHVLPPMYEDNIKIQSELREEIHQILREEMVTIE